MTSLDPAGGAARVQMRTALAHAAALPYFEARIGMSKGDIVTADTFMA